MPTGYTAKLCDGEQSFQDFVLTCARAFGALVDMRDDPMDAPIPDAIKVDSFYARSVTEAQSALESLKSMDGFSKMQLARDRLDHERAYHLEAIAKTKAIRTRLECALEKVNRWTPPSLDHIELKEFMIQQLTSTIDFDGSWAYHEQALEELKSKTVQEVIYAEISTLEKRLDRAKESLKEATERASERTRWITQLLESIKGYK